MTLCTNKKSNINQSHAPLQILVFVYLMSFAGCNPAPHSVETIPSQYDIPEVESCTPDSVHRIDASIDVILDNISEASQQDSSSSEVVDVFEIDTVDVCIPDCADKECGDDGCGGACGSCQDGAICFAPGNCCANEEIPCGVPGYECGMSEVFCAGEQINCGDCPEEKWCVEGVCTNGECGMEMLDLLGGNMLDLWVKLPYIYGVIDNGGLIVFDASTPKSPYIVVQYPLYKDLNRICGRDNTVYITGPQNSGIYGFDVSIPSEPVLVFSESASSPPTGFGVDLEVHGNYLFSSRGKNGVKIYDISVPHQPEIVAHYQTGYTITKTVIAWPLAFVTFYAGNVQVLDISTPENPVEIYNDDNVVQGPVFDAEVANSELYLYEKNAGLRIFNFAGPQNLLPVATIPVEEDLYSLSKKGEFLYAINSSGELMVFDLTSQGEASLVDSGHNSIVSFDDMEADSEFLYLIVRFRGLEILKTQIPTKLDLIGSVQVPTEIYDAAIHDNTLYLATKYGGLTIIDTSEPENLSVMGDLLLDSGACSVDIEQQLAVLRPCKSYPASALIQLVDIGNVSFPELKESIEVPGIGYQAVVNNANLYADWNSYIFGDAQSDETTAGINAWSLNEESEASLIAVHEMDKVPTNLLLDSGMLFVAWSHAWPFYDETECVGMDIYFVSDPDSWELVGTVSVDSWKPWRVLERYGDYIVAGTMLQDDTYVIDINDLYNPVVFGPIEIENVWDMQATHGHAFVVDKVELSIWSGANPLEPQLVEVLDPTPGWSRSLAVSHGYMFAESGGIASFDVRGCWAE